MNTRLSRSINAVVEFVACLCFLWCDSSATWWSARKPTPSGRSVPFGTTPPAPIGLAEPSVTAMHSWKRKSWPYKRHRWLDFIDYVLDRLVCWVPG